MTEMDVGSLSLDDVIKQKGIGRGNRRSSGAGATRQRRDGGIKKPSPKRNPKMWDNDKFYESERRGGTSRDFGVPRRNTSALRSFSSGGSSGKAIARLSNIPFTITQEDLEDLFADYSVTKIVLHYDFRGKSLGTADVHGNAGVLSKLERDFKNVEIDGRPLSISIVGESGGRSSLGGGMASRIRRVAGGGGRRDIRGASGDRRRSTPGSKRGGGEPRKKKLTADELDRELEDYMQGSKKD